MYPWRTDPGIVARLASTHVAYVQLESPAEFVSTDRREVAAWLHERAGLRVTVPDYEPSGIQLIGARLADARERRVGHLLYEKGRTLLSVFVLAPPEGDASLHGPRVSYRGEEYRTDMRNGYHTVAWAEGGRMFGLVSLLGHDALLECADRLRHEHAGMMPL